MQDDPSNRPKGESDPAPDEIEPAPSRLEEMALTARHDGQRSGTRNTMPDADNPVLLVRGVKAFMASDFDNAREWLLPFAEEGNGRAQTILAKMYFAGNGVEKDQERYMYWLGRAADGGDKTAKAKLKRLKKKLG